MHAPSHNRFIPSSRIENTFLTAKSRGYIIKLRGVDNGCWRYWIESVLWRAAETAPGLVSAYPSFMSLLGEHGVDKASLNQLTAALPQILEKVREAEPEKLEELVSQISQAVPGLEDLLPKREGKRRG